MSTTGVKLLNTRHMKKKRKDNNIYIPKSGSSRQSQGNPGKPNLNMPLVFINTDYDQFLRRQQQLKTRKK